MILVTGAAGKTGLAVIRALSKSGEPTRALVHRAEHVALAHEAGANEVLAGDIFDRRVLAKSLSGVEAVYLICPNVHPQEFGMGQAVIAAAKAEGAARVVYHSVMYPQIEAMPHHWQKLRVEEELIQSGLDFAILQPASYMQNILPYWEAIRTRGEYRVPYSVEAMFSPIDLDDAAEVAIRVLREPQQNGAIYQLAGPQVLSSRQMAEIVGDVLGRKVEAVEQSLDEWRSVATRRGINAYSLEALSKMFGYYDQHGFSGSGAMLEKLLGRPAKDFRQFIERLTK